MYILSVQHGASRGCMCMCWPTAMDAVANIFNEHSRRADKERYSILWVGCCANNSSAYRNRRITKYQRTPQSWTDSMDTQTRLRNNVIFLHPVARSIIQSFSSVFVRHF
jgi:hypothetical protein